MSSHEAVEPSPTTPTPTLDEEEPTMNIAVLHGTNLNRLGKRRPEKYGYTTLQDITTDVEKTAARLGVTTLSLQSNSEQELIEFIHEHQHEFDGIVINPAGFTSYAYGLLDAVRDTGHPFAVVHISQWWAIDGKQRPELFADSATVFLSGAGWRGYSLALEAIVHKVRGD